MMPHSVLCLWPGTWRAPAPLCPCILLSSPPVSLPIVHPLLCISSMPGSLICPWNYCTNFLTFSLVPSPTHSPHHEVILLKHESLYSQAYSSSRVFSLHLRCSSESSPWFTRSDVGSGVSPLTPLPFGHYAPGAISPSKPSHVCL